MKKLFLTLAAAAIAASPAMADEATFDFVGTGDAYGIKRIFSNPTSADLFTQSNPFTITNDDGVVSLTFSWEGTNAFGMDLFSTVTGSGLYVGRNDENTNIKIGIPGATISAVTLLLGNEYATVDLQGTVISHGWPNNSDTYAWEGSATDSFNITIGEDEYGDPQNNYYIKGVSVTYEKGAVQKQPASLSFSQMSAEAILGNVFTAPTLTNPNGLNVTWTSSNPDVATVDAEGNVTLIGSGKTVIKASSDETDQFYAGEATFALTVIPMASNIAEMLSGAPNVADKVIVNTDLTVVYATPIALWVIDNVGNATQLNIKSSLETGDIIPAGWTAVNSSSSNNVTFNGTIPESLNSTEVTYPTVGTISLADNNRVLTLEGVTFNESTPAEPSETFVGTDAYGNAYTFINSYNLDAVDAGTYDVLLIVKAWDSGSGLNYRLTPISYNTHKEVVTVIKEEEMNFKTINTSSDRLHLVGADNELPYTIEGTNVALTLESHNYVSSNPEKYTAFEANNNGLFMRGGIGLLNFSAGNNKVVKVVIVSDNMTFSCNGENLTEAEVGYDYQYTWVRPADYTENYVEIEANTEYDGYSTNRWLYSATVYYETLGVDLPTPELSFNIKETTLSMGDVTLDTAEILNNPQALPIVWKSNNEDVATVENGIVTLKSEGSAVITATIEESDIYAEAEASFTIFVLNAALNIPQMIVMAPEYGDKVKIYNTNGFYVAYPLIGSYTQVGEDGTESKMYDMYLFVEDKFGNPALLHKTSTSSQNWRTDDTIEGGWTATHENNEYATVWMGTFSIGSRVNFYFDDPKIYESLNNVANDYKVITLKNVTLKDGSPEGKEEFNGILGEDEELTLVNLVNTASNIPGVYNITGAAGMTAEGKRVFYPAAYTLIKEIETGVIEALDTIDADAIYYNLQGNVVANPAPGIYVKVANGKAVKVIVK